MKLKTGNISLKTKLFGFVGITSLLVLAAVGVGAYYFSGIESAGRMKDEVGKTVEKLLVARVAEKTFLQFYTADLKEQFTQRAGEVGTDLEKLKQSASSEEWKKHIGAMGTEFANYRKLFGELVELHGQQGDLKEEMVKPIRASEALLKGIQADIESKQAQLQMEGETLTAREFGMLNVVKDCRTAFIQVQNLQLQFLVSGDQKFVQEYKKLATGNVQSYLTALEQFSSALKNESWVKTATSVRESLVKFLDYIEKSQRLFQNETEKLKALNDRGTGVMGAANMFLGEVDRLIEAQKSMAVRIISSILLAGLLFFWGLSVLLVRSITRPINHAIFGLTEVADQVGASAGEVSNSSQQMANGASRQAAAVEQTSSSLEEMASMTKQNAKNADQANRLMAEAKQTISQASLSMEGLTESMGQISKASEQTQKIIKTIDEVAFQTNLLALNAAVEAARAGEAGAGFAVVADEVRNLARRAAEAAKNTAVLIEATVKTVNEGATLVGKTNDEFNHVSLSASKVGELVGEIAAASQEQAQGIDQVNRAVAEMDKVIQQNAANSEATASASMEMTSRAEQMKDFVGNLAGLVGGGKNGGKRSFDEARYEDKTGGGLGGLLASGVARLASKTTAKLSRQKPQEDVPVEHREIEQRREEHHKQSEQRYLHTF